MCTIGSETSKRHVRKMDRPCTSIDLANGQDHQQLRKLLSCISHGTITLAKLDGCSVLPPRVDATIFEQ
jgi:hypothetical protein